MNSAPTFASARGSLHRTVRVAVGDGEARAVVEDDFHRFRVTIGHEAGVVTRAEAEAFRFPYSLCPAAGERLTEIVGMAVTPLMADVFRRTDARLQCTHQFDLAALAVAAAARGTARRYDVEVPDPVDGSTVATLDRDGARVMAWRVEAYAIAAPARFDGISLGAGFTDWVTANLDTDEAEAALVLRRGVFISRGRAMIEALDRAPHAMTTGGCWVQQPGRSRTATREIGSARDFTGGAHVLTAADDAWLAFAMAG
jgi:hypothetical protein